MFSFFKWYIKKYRRIFIIKFKFYYKYRWEIFWELWRILSTPEVLLFYIDKIYFKYEKLKYWILYFVRKFFNIFKRKHFCYLYDTIRSDIQWLINYFDPRIDSSIKKKWYVYIWFLFKRFLKIWFWVYIIALKPLILIKILCILIIRLMLKYAFIVMDIIVMDIIVTDIINISVPYIYVRDIIKYVILDLPFYIIPNLIMWIFSFAGVYHMLKVTFIRIDTKLYDIQKHGYTRSVVRYRRMKANYYSWKFKRNRRIFLKKKYRRLKQLRRRIWWHNLYVKYSFLMAFIKNPSVSIGITFDFLRQFLHLALIYVSVCFKYNIKFIFGQIICGFKLWRYKIYNVYITIRCDYYYKLKKNIFSFFYKWLNMIFVFFSRLKFIFSSIYVDNISLDEKREFSLKDMLFYKIVYGKGINYSSFDDINDILVEYKFLAVMHELFVNAHEFIVNIIKKNENDTTIALNILKSMVLLLKKIKLYIELKKNSLNIDDALIKAQVVNSLSIEERVDLLVAKYKKDGLLSKSYKISKPFDLKISDSKISDSKISDSKISDLKKNDLKKNDLKVSDVKIGDFKSKLKKSDVKIGDIENKFKKDDVKIGDSKLKNLTASEIKSKFKIGDIKNDFKIGNIKLSDFKIGDFKVSDVKIGDFKKIDVKTNDIGNKFKKSNVETGDIKINDLVTSDSIKIFESVQSKSLNNISKTSFFSISNLYSLNLEVKKPLISDIGSNVDKDKIDSKWINKIKFYLFKASILVNKFNILLNKLLYGWKGKL